MKVIPTFSAVLLLTALFLGFLYLKNRNDSILNGQATSAPVELLLVGDPFAHNIQNQLEQIRQSLGFPMRLSIRRYTRTYETILANHMDQESYFHLISFDILWLPELVENNILLPLSIEELARYGFDPEDHHAVTLALNSTNEKLYGLPIQPHPELLWYRKDLFAQRGLTLPQNTDELVALAKKFHDPENQFYGIGWNALRGQALGQTVAHLYAAFGRPFIDSERNVSVNTPEGEQLSEFLLQLMDSSPPDILSMAWDQRIERFTRGRSAFTYGWMARSQSAERNPLSEVQGKVGYILPPPAPGVSPAVPMGQWSLGIPANISADERERALKTLVHLVSDEVDQILFQEGFHGHHRSRGTVTDMKLEKSPGYRIVHELLAEGNISSEARPMIPEWSAMADILGVVFHDMLRGDISIENALEKGQYEIERLLAGEHFESP